MTGSFWNLCKEVDRRNRSRPRKEVQEEGSQFAASTLDAARWLRKHQPDGFADFCDRHEGLKEFLEKAP